VCESQGESLRWGIGSDPRRKEWAMDAKQIVGHGLGAALDAVEAALKKHAA
jgi:hypothetical protein